MFFLFFFILYFFEWLIGAFIPNNNGSRTIVTRWNDAFKCAVIVRVIFHHHGEPSVCWIERWSFGNGPAFQHPFYFQPEVIMQVRSGMFLDNKPELITE